jgi:hypothetical protein
MIERRVTMGGVRTMPAMKKPGVFLLAAGRRAWDRRRRKPK